MAICVPVLPKVNIENLFTLIYLALHKFCIFKDTTVIAFDTCDPNGPSPSVGYTIMEERVLYPTIFIES